MAFHMTMMMVVLAVSLGMHAMASAGPLPEATTEPSAEAYQAQVQEAGGELNKHLAVCREHAQRTPKASQRELKACERTARTLFKQDVKQARAQVKAEKTAAQ